MKIFKITEQKTGTLLAEGVIYSDETSAIRLHGCRTPMLFQMKFSETEAMKYVEDNSNKKAVFEMLPFVSAQGDKL